MLPTCPDCGAANPESAPRCSGCGRSLEPKTTGAGATAAQTVRSLAEPVPALQAAPIQGRLGHYQILEEVGRGGMGAVYRAVDTGLHRTVALKVLRSDPGPRSSSDDRTRSNEELLRFLREAQTTAQLHHPNIVQVYEVGEAAGTHYLAMEFVEGGSLRDRISGPAERPRDRVRVVAQVARAVHHAHEMGIIHRDLKPGNILLAVREQAGEKVEVPMVADFGLARAVREQSDLTATGQILGTPSYMSPEQCDGHTDLDGRSDVFSLGAVLYELLTGARPFTGATPMAVMYAVICTEPVPARRLHPRLHADLETVLQKALAKEPERRYASARAFAEDLERWLEGEPIQARPPTLGYRVTRGLRRNRAAAAGVALAAVLGCGWLWNLAEASGERRRLEAEREAARTAQAAAEQALIKAGRVQTVLARWLSLAGTLDELDGIRHDTTKTVEEQRRAAEGPWTEVADFMAATPPDPASQAVMKALSGWARRLAGREDEGLAWMREARSLDPALPYGALLEALACLGDYLDRQDLPITMQGGGGLQFGPMPAESAEMAALRERMQPLLGEAARAALWGEGIAEDFRRTLEAVRALQEGRSEEAERGMTAALGSAAMHVFRTDLRMARGKVRYLQLRLDEAAADFEKTLEVRRNHAPGWLHLGIVRMGIAGRDAARGGDALGEFERALAALGEAIRCHSAYPNARNARGNTWISLADLQARRGIDPLPACASALADLQEALRLRPDFEEARGNLGLAWMKRGRAEAARGLDPRESYAKAVAAYGAVLERRPGFAPVLMNRAVVQCLLAEWAAASGEEARGHYQDAIRELDLLLSAEPRRADVLALRANAWRGIGQEAARRNQCATAWFENALRDFDAALSVDPQSAGTWNDRAAAGVDMGNARLSLGEPEGDQFDRALADYGESLRLNPQLEAGCVGRSSVYVRRGELALARGGDPMPDLACAIADLDRALALDPRNVGALNNRGSARILAGDVRAARGEDPVVDYRSAIADFEAGKKLNPQETTLDRNLGAARVRLGTHQMQHGGDARDVWEAAVRDYDAILVVHPQSGEALRVRAQCRWMLGQIEQVAGRDPTAAWNAAEADLAAALAVDPRDAQAWALRGLLRHRAGRWAEALVDLEAALGAGARDPQLATARDECARRTRPVAPESR